MKKGGIDMTRKNNYNNKGNIDTNTDHFQLPIEEPNIVAIPTQDNNNLVAPSSSVKYTIFVIPSSSLITESGPLVDPPSKVTIAIIDFETNKYEKGCVNDMKNSEYDT